MKKVCPKCFCIIDDGVGQHMIWCPDAPDVIEELKEMFGIDKD